MASSKLFADIPPFPNDVPTTPLYTISLSQLRSNDACTTKTVFKACQELGFFLLDLRGDDVGDALIGEIDELFKAGKDIFGLSESVKTEFVNDAPRSFLGFKPRGRAHTETSQPDRFEWFNLGQDPLLGTVPPQPLPPLITSHLPLFTSFLHHGQTVISTICSVLATQLGLPPATFTSLQRVDKPSGTVIRLLKTFASPGANDLRTSMIHHTDIGTITLLANVVGGLQILAPGSKASDASAWSWVKPRPGHLIVNLGDAMVQWSGGLLRSNVHRIRHAPGDQRSVDRYSLAYLVRPEREASMRRLVEKGEMGEDDKEAAGLSAWEWEVKKTMAYVRGEAETQSTGGNVTSEKL